MGFLDHCRFRAQDARQVPYHCIHDHHRRQLPTSQYVVANADLVRYQVFYHPLVHSLIMSADEDELFLSRQLTGDPLGEESALRGEKDDGERSDFGIRLLDLALDRLHRGENRLWLHYHTGAAPIGVIIHYVVLIGGIVAYIMEKDAYQSPLPGTFDNAFIKGPPKHAREKGQNIDSHLCFPFSRYPHYLHCILTRPVKGETGILAN